MKKTLFAMAAVALCGTTFAADIHLAGNKTYTKADLDVYSVYDNLFFGDNTTIIMDGYDVSGSGDYFNRASVTLTGKTTLVQNQYGDGLRFKALTLGSGASIVVEVSDSVIDYMLETLLPYYHNHGRDYVDTGVFYVGSSGTEWSELRSAFAVPGVLTLGEDTVSRFNEHGITEILPTGEKLDNVFYAGEGEGKAGINIWYTFSVYTGTPLSTPTTPEPATATLSLLALAGLAARRRRH